MRLLLSTATCVLLFAASTLAQSKSSFVGTWKLDVSKSDFGSHPAPKSNTLHIFKEGPEMGSYRDDVIDNKGEVESFSWHGPEDGSTHPALMNGKEIFNESQQEEAGAVLRRGENSHGSFEARITISDDGKTMTVLMTVKGKDGKETQQKHIFERVSGSA